MSLCSNRNLDCVTTAFLYITADAKRIVLEGGHHNNINELRVCRKNKNEIYLISMDESGYIRCWNAKTPQKQYWDFTRHNDSINAVSIMKLNTKNKIQNYKSRNRLKKYDYILCTASRDKTVRGLIPDGEIVFNIADSEDTLELLIVTNIILLPLVKIIMSDVMR